MIVLQFEVTFIIFFTNSWILLKLHSNKNEHTYSKTRVCALGLTLGHSLFLSLSPRPSPSERRGGGGLSTEDLCAPGGLRPYTFSPQVFLLRYILFFFSFSNAAGWTQLTVEFSGDPVQPHNGPVDSLHLLIFFRDNLKVSREKTTIAFISFKPFYTIIIPQSSDRNVLPHSIIYTAFSSSLSP